jgi:hypothetical protein
MLPMNADWMNITLVKPEKTTDEECYELRAMRGEMEFGKDENGQPQMVTFHLVGFYPSKEDLEALNAGRGFYLRILGGGFPPVALFTVDENGEIND